MSYTPENQLISDRCDNAIRALDELAHAMRARIDDPDEWNKDHLIELTNFLVQMDQIRLPLRILQSENR